MATHTSVCLVPRLHWCLAEYFIPRTISLLVLKKMVLSGLEKLVCGDSQW